MEYYLKRTSKYLYTVSKFNDSTLPQRVYIVEYHPSTDKGRCNCWNKVNCLHIRMVKEWFHMCCPIGGFYYWPATDDHEEEIQFFSLPYAEGFYFDSKGQLAQ
jgi:hypothetical protein